MIRDDADGPRDGYVVRVDRRGRMAWNGQDVDDATLRRYLAEYAALPEDAGRLWVEFEPGSTADAASAVRRAVMRSGLCAERRCVEGRWDARRPVVN